MPAFFVQRLRVDMGNMGERLERSLRRKRGYGQDKIGMRCKARMPGFPALHFDASNRLDAHRAKIRKPATLTPCAFPAAFP